MQYRIWIHLVLAIFVAWFDVLNAKLGSKEFMACGGLSTAITDLLLFPLDTIKVTQQSSKQLMTSSEAFKQILNSGGGAAALYKGAIGYATMDGVGAALFFAVYERVKRYTIEDLHLSGPCLSASVYGAAAAAFGVSSIVLGIFNCSHDNIIPISSFQLRCYNFIKYI